MAGVFDQRENFHRAAWRQGNQLRREIGRGEMQTIESGAGGTPDHAVRIFEQ